MLYGICLNNIIIFIYFSSQNVQRKKEKINTVQNESGEEAFNRNHRAYNIRLPQLNQFRHSIIKLSSDCNVLFPFSPGMLSVMCSCLSASFGITLQLSTRFKLKIFTRRFILNFLCLAALIILKKWHLQYQFSALDKLV